MKKDKKEIQKQLKTSLMQLIKSEIGKRRNTAPKKRVWGGGGVVSKVFTKDDKEENLSQDF